MTQLYLKKKSSYDKKIEKIVRNFSEADIKKFKLRALHAFLKALAWKQNGGTETGFGLSFMLLNLLQTSEEMESFFKMSRDGWEKFIIITIKFEKEMRELMMNDQFSNQPKTEGGFIVEFTALNEFNIPEVSLVKGVV